MSIYDRKVSKFGNSFGLTLPADLMKKVGLNQGDDVEVTEKDGKIILHKKENLILPEGVDANFIKILKEVIDEHDEAFRGLVDRWVEKLFI